MISTNNNNNGSAEHDNKNIICESAGCYPKPTNKIALKVGTKRTIFLFLWDICKPKFCPEQSNCNQLKLEANFK
jgi:hypothetical protein